MANTLKIDWTPIIEAAIAALIQSGMIQDLITIIMNWLKGLTLAQQATVLTAMVKKLPGWPA